MSHGILTHDSMFSVRQTPWHGLGAVLDEYPQSIEEALEKSGLGWSVRSGDIYVASPMTAPVFSDEIPPGQLVSEGGVIVPQLESVLRPAKGFKANVREDTGEVLGIVSEDYKIVPNEDAFKFLDSLIGSELHFETAGSLGNGRRVWVLVRLPEFVEIGGDQVANYIYVANSHDGSMAVTAAATSIRVVCANTLGAALRRSEHGDAAERTYKFRHTGDLSLKYDEARKVMGIAVNYGEQFKALGDGLALEPISENKFGDVLDTLFDVKNEDLGDIAKRNRQRSKDSVLNIFRGNGPDGDTTGNAPGTKWTAVNAVAEHADWCRRTTKKTDQVQRSFEDQALKQRGLDLILAS